MIRGKTPLPTPAKIGVGPEVSKTAENHLSPKLSKISCLIPRSTQLRRNCFLSAIPVKWLCNLTVNFNQDLWSILATNPQTRIWTLIPWPRQMTHKMESATTTRFKSWLVTTTTTRSHHI